MIVREAAIQSELLLLRHRRGDPQALPELVALWERPLLYYLRRLLASEEDAWDALQETWIRVMGRLAGVRDGRALPAWLYIVARSAAFTLRRRRRPAEPLPEGDDEPELPAEDPEPSLAGFHAMDVHRALARLGLAHREALTLHFLEGFSVAEIAIITDAAEGTIKSRLHYAKRALRALLEGGD
ncbi:MAG TPA: RNA polymerase sigma factor [Terriglobales bacterium]|nr:RNA polymerase sigma factor [Terriglobales bacterium]